MGCCGFVFFAQKSVGQGVNSRWDEAAVVRVVLRQKMMPMMCFIKDKRLYSG